MGSIGWNVCTAASASIMTELTAVAYREENSSALPIFFHPRIKSGMFITSASVPIGSCGR